MKFILTLLVLLGIILGIMGQGNQPEPESDLVFAGHNRPCSAAVRCRPEKNFVCLNKVCQCFPGGELDLHFEGCLLPPTISNDFSCSTHTQCQFHSTYGNYSYCDKNDTKKCKCDDSEVLVKEVNHTCVIPKDFNTACKLDNECKALTDGEVVCEKSEDSDEGLCNCAKESKYNGTACVPVRDRKVSCPPGQKCSGATGNLPLIGILWVSVVVTLVFELE